MFSEQGGPANGDETKEGPVLEHRDPRKEDQQEETRIATPVGHGEHDH